MIWQSKKVNLNNYNEVFKDYTVDVREVIRSAILDDTDIAKYIRCYRDDAFMLWQIKLAIDEGVNPRWFSATSRFTTIKKIRQLKYKGINVDSVLPYIEGNALTETCIEYILKWFERGVVLEKYDFSILPNALLDVFDYGVGLRYPMYIFNNGVQYTDEYIRLCLKILSNKKQISKFLNGDWDIANLSLLAKYSSTKYYDILVEYVSVSITPSILEGLYECCRIGIPLERVAIVDEDGIYIYSREFIELIISAFTNKYDYTKLLGASMSEAYCIYSELELESSRKLSGRFRKN